MPDPNEEREKKLREIWNRKLKQFPELSQYGDRPWGSSLIIPKNVASHWRRLEGIPETPTQTPSPGQVPTPVPQQQPGIDEQVSVRKYPTVDQIKSAWQGIKGWTEPQQEYDPTVKTAIPDPVDWGQRFSTLGTGLEKFAKYGALNPLSIAGRGLRDIWGVVKEESPDSARLPQTGESFTDFLKRTGVEELGRTGLGEITQVSQEVAGPAAGLAAAYGWQGEQGEKGEQAVRARAKELRDQGIGWAMAYDQALKEAEKYGEVSPLQSFVSREITDPIEAITPGIGISKAIRAGSKQALDVAKKQVAKQIPEQAKITGPFRGDIDQIKSDITTSSPDLEDIRGQKNAKSLLAAKEKEIHDRVETIFMDRFDPKTGAVKELAEEDAAYINYHLGKDLPFSPFKPKPLSKVDVPDVRPVTRPAVKATVSEPLLPRELRGAKPRYNIGRDQYIPAFDSDIDRALFIVAQKTPSRRDADYMNWLRNVLPDMDELSIRQAGKEVREHIKNTVRGQESGSIQIPRSRIAQEVRQPSVTPDAPSAIPEELIPGSGVTPDTILDALSKPLREYSSRLLEKRLTNKLGGPSASPYKKFYEAELLRRKKQPEIPVFTGRFAQPPPVVRYKEDIDDIRNIWEDVSVKDPELLSEQKFFNEQSVDDLLDAVTATPGRFRNILAGLPGAGRIFGRTVVSGRTKDLKFGFRPSTIAVDRSEIARTADIEGVGYRLFQALQDGKSSGRLARFGEDVFDIDETGMLSLTDGSAKMFDEVMENPGQYINSITPQQYQWIKDAHQLTKQLAENYQAVSGKKLIVDKGGREYYWPRFTIKDDKLNFAKPSGEKIGAKQTPEYNRLFTNIEEGIEKGVNYNTSPQAILSLYSGALDKMIRDQIFIKRWIKKGIGKDPTEVKGRPFIPEWQQKRGLDEQIVLDPEAIKELSGPLGMPKDFLRPVEMVAAVPKFLVTAVLDTGQFMIQGLTLLATTPVGWAQATKAAVGEIFKPGNYNKMLNSPKYKELLNDASSHGMDVDALVEYLDAIAKPGPFQRGLSKIPVVRTLAERFQKGFQAYMGLGRLHMYEAMSDFIKAGKTGINPKTGLQYTTKEIDDQLFQAARQADSLLGGTNTKALGISATQRQVENGILFFAPRYTRAVYGVVGHALGTGMTADFTRRTLGKMAFGAILIVAGLNGLSGTARGKSRTQIAQGIEDSLNPRKGAKFLSVKVGNQYIGVGGGFRAMARLITSLFSEEEWRRSMEDPSTSNKILRNPLVKGFRSKAPIVTGTLIDTIDEQDYVGGEFSIIDNPAGFFEEGVKRNLPFPIQAFIEAAAYDDAGDLSIPDWGRLGGAVGVAGIEFLGGRTIPESASEKRTEIGREFLQSFKLPGSEIPLGDMTVAELAEERGYKFPSEGAFAVPQADLQKNIEEYWELPPILRKELESHPDFDQADKNYKGSLKKFNMARYNYYEEREKLKGAQQEELQEMIGNSISRNPQQPMKHYRLWLRDNNILSGYAEESNKIYDKAVQQGAFRKSKSESPFRRAEEVYYNLLYSDDEDTFKEAFKREYVSLEKEGGEFNWDERNRREEFLRNTYGDKFVTDIVDSNRMSKYLPDEEKQRRKDMDVISKIGYWNVDEELAIRHGVKDQLEEYKRLQDINDLDAKEYLDSNPVLKTKVIGQVSFERQMKRLTNPDLDGLLYKYGYTSKPVVETLSPSTVFKPLIGGGGSTVGIRRPW